MLLFLLHTRRQSISDFSKRGRYELRLPVLVCKHTGRISPDTTALSLIHSKYRHSPFAVHRYACQTRILPVGRVYVALPYAYYGRGIFGEAAWQGTISRIRLQPYTLRAIRSSLHEPRIPGPWCDWLSYSGQCSVSAFLAHSPYSMKRLRILKAVVMRCIQMITLTAC